MLNCALPYGAILVLQNWVLTFTGACDKHHYHRIFTRFGENVVFLSSF
jgi:hypothetical protein